MVGPASCTAPRDVNRVVPVSTKLTMGEDGCRLFCDRRGRGPLGRSSPAGRRCRLSPGGSPRACPARGECSLETRRAIAARRD